MATESDFIATLPSALRAILDSATAITNPAADDAQTAAHMIDHTSLNNDSTPMIGSETPDDIRALCQAAMAVPDYHVASLCVYPNHIATARNALLNTDIRITAVNNFPHGTASAQNAAQQARDAMTSGADEIDTVIDYRAFLNGDLNTVQEKLRAVKNACGDTIILKTILKATVYDRYDDLYAAATLACKIGADFVKTCTGKPPMDGFGTGSADASTPARGAVVMQAVADYNRAHNTRIGVKISGGVKTTTDCAQYRYLVDNILGPEFYTPQYFRFGASSLLGNLLPNRADSPTLATGSDY